MYDLYLVTDEKLCLGRNMADVVRQAAEGGVTMVQLREKDLNTRLFIERARQIKDVLKPYHIPLIINDRVDVALAVNADGIHIGQTDMPFHLLTKIIPDYMLVGLSVENMKQAEEAQYLKLDYLGVSPVFATPTKTNFEEQPWLLDGLKKLRAFSRQNLVAIGGINSVNASDVIKSGADGIAVVSAICSAPDPAQAAHELLNIVHKAKMHNCSKQLN